MDPIKTTGAALAGISVVLLTLVQFLPWGTFEESEPGVSYEVEANSWTVEYEYDVDVGDFGGGDFDSADSDTHSWYDEEADDSEGVDQIRIAAPFLAAALLAAVIAALLGFLTRGPGAAFATLAAALFLVVATILYIQGMSAFFEEGGVDHDWSASFYLAIASCALLIVGGVLGLVAGNRSRTA